MSWELSSQVPDQAGVGPLIGVFLVQLPAELLSADSAVRRSPPAIRCAPDSLTGQSPWRAPVKMGGLPIAEASEEESSPSRTGRDFTGSGRSPAPGGRDDGCGLPRANDGHADTHTA